MEKQTGIILTNINLTGISKNDQLKKVKEEFREFTDAMCEFICDETEENKNHFIDEYLDLLQSALGLLDKFGIKAEEVQAYYPKHLEKLKTRPRTKKCSKCRRYLENPNNSEIFICAKEENEIKTDKTIAKGCKYYDERE